MHHILIAITLFCLILVAYGQTCDSNQFKVRNGNGEEYLTINSATEVKTCGGVNICTEINSAKQSLSLSNDGGLSISNGNSVQLPDTSSTNEIQTLQLDPSGQLSISAGNSVSIPDNSATNEIQVLALNSDQISLSKGGGSVTLPDPSASNEIQTLSIEDNQISITQGNTVQLPDWRVWSYKKVINYTGAVSVTSTTWASVPTYDLYINFPQSLSVLQITLLVPYSGCAAQNKRGRAQLFFDGTVLSDVTLFGPGAFQLAPVQLCVISMNQYLLINFDYSFGMVQNVTPGNHVIQVKAFVDSGNTLYLPANDPAYGEGVAPAIFGSYNLLGYP